ncbi:MAG: DNA/RNA non-specific endonuclease [Bacteroidales bacterium]|nr:DNA/RNA non-specific endonuclease [Bacteroidales bacterium]
MKLFRRNIFPLIFACLLLAVPSCRHASSQTARIEQNDGREWTRDIDLPVTPADRSEQILYRKAYVVSYNKETRQPNWVAWKLTAEHTQGDVQRPATAWHEDYEVPEPRIYYSDYKHTNWDRGHMCPAGDNKWDKTAMYESFLLSNACPQNKTLNSGIWNQIEMKCREWARKYGEVQIVCGPIFMNCEHDTIGENRLPVPEAFFKVVLIPVNGELYGTGFICRNNEGNKKKDLYHNSIPEVERITGIKFFPNSVDIKDFDY